MKINFTKGFTLIELLVVIAIIGLLSSVVLASLNGARVRARDAQRLSDLRQIDNAIQLYIDANGHAPFLTAIDGTNCDASDPVTVRAIPDGSGICQAASTDNASWSVFSAELAPYIKVPIDPVNTNATPLILRYVYAAPGNMSNNCDPLIDDGSNGPNRCVNIFGNNNVYGLYAGAESKGGMVGGDTSTYFFSPSTPRSFVGRIGSR